YFQIGAMVMHTPSGVFLYGAYGTEDVDNRFIDVTFDDPEFDKKNFQRVEDTDHWFLKAGIRRNWLPYGATIFYGELARYNDMYGGFACAFTIATTKIGKGCRTDKGIEITGSELDRWGLGVVQEFDSASMQMYAKFVQLDGEIDFRTRDGHKYDG